MNILALDSSTNACSIALLHEKTILQKYEILPRQHESVLLNWIHNLCKEAGITLSELSAVAYSCGPGSFTGIRIGAAFGQGIALAMQIPLLPIPSLQILAQGIYRQFKSDTVVIALDARMNQFYWGQYQIGKKGLMQPLQPNKLCELKDLKQMIQEPGHLAIDHTLSQGLNLPDRTLIDFYPHAMDILPLAAEVYQTGDFLPLEEAVPLYLRNEESWKKLSDSSSP